MFKNYSLNSRKMVLFPSPGEPSAFPTFRTCPEAEEAVAAAARSCMANIYAPSPGIFKARKAVADHLNGELPSQLREEDVYITGCCNQAIEIVIESIAGNLAANILLPWPGYPHYDAHAINNGIQIRKYDLLPERDFEIDLDGFEAQQSLSLFCFHGLEDENTIAMVLINPNNPYGNVYTYDHLNKVFVHIINI
ncbi:probable aminotransferase TAT3 [Eutrema salsugineum]|uniref:probable aminotransferase TAT3 n=1 Tax=Eutrema salsugineum TaxID=72664 RepID=UPI000CECEC9F|nr:probable aminotransferase TAT3 [Eutrema salsugineum]